MMELPVAMFLVMLLLSFVLGGITVIVISCGYMEGYIDSQREPEDGSLFDYKYTKERRLTDGNEVKKPKDH